MQTELAQGDPSQGDSGNEISCSSSEPPPFDEGQIIWINLKGHPLWPGTVRTQKPIYAHPRHLPNTICQTLGPWSAKCKKWKHPPSPTLHSELF